MRSSAIRARGRSSSRRRLRIAFVLGMTTASSQAESPHEWTVSKCS